MAKLLHPGDSVSTTLSISAPVGDERGDPWVKAEVSNNTIIRPKETYKKAIKRSERDAQRRLERQFRWLVKEVKNSRK